MQFDAFCRAHGLMVDGIQTGRWIRVPTDDHPRSRNGAYKFLGDHGFVQNWATMLDVAIWRAESSDEIKIDPQRVAREAQQFDDAQRCAWARAAVQAASMIERAKVGEHNYLHSKSIGDQSGLVDHDGALLVPMRHWRTNKLQGVQVIRWLPDERRYEKKMLHGSRAKGAVFRIGSGRRAWLVEGYATGLSLACALQLLRSLDAVVVCFSAGNLIYVAQEMGGSAVFADNDESGAGERAAKATGLPYVMSPVIGEDANDVHARAGVFKLAQMVMGVQA